MSSGPPLWRVLERIADAEQSVRQALEHGHELTPAVLTALDQSVGMLESARLFVEGAARSDHGEDTG